MPPWFWALKGQSCEEAPGGWKRTQRSRVLLCHKLPEELYHVAKISWLESLTCTMSTVAPDSSRLKGYRGMGEHGGGAAETTHVGAYQVLFHHERLQLLLSTGRWRTVHLTFTVTMHLERSTEHGLLTWLSALSPGGCVIWGKLFNVIEPQVLICRPEIIGPANNR